jgi:hypothetical protein
MFTKKVVAALITTVVLVALLAAPVLAGNGVGNGQQAPEDRPGWGYGDSKHNHTGPPGLVDDERPGWGYGDNNHTHTGPPGQVKKGS